MIILIRFGWCKSKKKKNHAGILRLRKINYVGDFIKLVWQIFEK